MGNKLRIVHTADIHFDAPFSSLDASLARQRKNELKQSFETIIETVKTKNADLLVIAGDLFDSENTNHLTVEFINSMFSRIPDTYIFISAGNHDPKTQTSYYNMLDLRENVHIFSGEFEKISIDALDLDVYGISFTSAFAQGLGLPKVQNAQKTNLLVMHADTQTDSGYNSVSAADIENSGFDYVALGHIHQPVISQKIGLTPWAYCGTPEPKGFDETGDKGVLYVEIEKPSVSIEFVKTCKRNYYTEQVDVSGAENHREIAEMASSRITDGHGLYKIVLTGETALSVSTQYISDALTGKCFFAKVYDKTLPLTDYKKYANTNTLKGLFVKLMLEKIEKCKDDAERQICTDALKTGFDVLDGKEVSVIED